MRALILVFGSILHFSYGIPFPSHQDYVYLKGSNNMYKFYVEGASWADAKTECANDAAEFYFPEDEAEATAVKELFKLNNAIWVGVFRSSKNKYFNTMDGRLFDDVYHDWFATPDEVNHCVKLYSTGKFHNVPCNYVYSFICKYRPGVNALAQPYNCGTSTGAVTC